MAGSSLENEISHSATPSKANVVKLPQWKSGLCACLTSYLSKIRVPSYDFPAAQQPRPFSLNRYVLLGIYFLVVLTTGGVHYGWRNISNMLVRSDAFIWLCVDPAKPWEYEKTSAAEAVFICDAQDAAIQRLFTIAIACQFIGCGISGFTIDRFGVKVTACVGQVLQMSSWILLSFCGSGLRAYEAVYVLLGLGADTSFLPTLVVCFLFPEFNATVITIMGAAVSASFAMPLVLDEVWMANETLSFSQLCLWYAGVANGGCLLLCALFLPVKPFKGDDQLQIDEQLFGVCWPDQTTTADVATTTDVDQSSRDKLPVCSDGHSVESKHARPYEQATIDDLVECNPVHLHLHSLDADESGMGLSIASKSMRLEGSVVQQDGSTWTDGEDKRSKTKPVSFRRQVFSSYYLGIVIHFCIVGLAFVFYTEAAERMLGRAVERSLMILVPFSFIPCVIIGRLIDILGIMPVICAINVVGVLMYATVLTGVEVLGYVSVVLSVIYVSVFTSQLYCYVECTFPSLHFVALVGISGGVGGCFSLLSNVLYDLTISTLDGNVMIVSGVLLSVLLANFVLIFYLWRLKRKNPRPFDLPENVGDKRNCCTTSEQELGATRGKPPDSVVVGGCTVAS
eukprot:GHVQ01023844.1.p1 GENE.GHVQ01023844.1~~GHVQ01023844.1.p1  ORF type:complete len:624 (-),score=45.75 GHVQ01023844.1:859-2730(-)